MAEHIALQSELQSCMRWHCKLHTGQLSTPGRVSLTLHRLALRWESVSMALATNPLSLWLSSLFALVVLCDFPVSALTQQIRCPGRFYPPFSVECRLAVTEDIRNDDPSTSTATTGWNAAAVADADTATVVLWFTTPHRACHQQSENTNDMWQLFCFKSYSSYDCTKPLSVYHMYHQSNQ